MDLAELTRGFRAGRPPLRRRSTGRDLQRASRPRRGRPRLRRCVRTAVGGVRCARRDGAPRGDLRSARVGSRAAGRRRGARATSCSCCGAVAPSRRCATTPPSCASVRTAGRSRVRSSCTSRTRSSSRRTAAPVWSRGCARCRCRRRGAARRRRAARRTRPSCWSRRWRCATSSSRAAPSARPGGSRSAHGASALVRARRLPDGRSRGRAVRAAGLPPARSAGGRGAASRFRSGSSCAGSVASPRPRCPRRNSRAVVDAIYAVYGVHVPGAALEPLRAAAAVWTARPARFRLLPPTA